MKWVEGIYKRIHTHNCGGVYAHIIPSGNRLRIKYLDYTKMHDSVDKTWDAPQVTVLFSRIEDPLCLDCGEARPRLASDLTYEVGMQCWSCCKK